MTLIQLYILLGIFGGSTYQAYAARYDIGVMERVARNRGMDAVPCMLASPTLPIGSWVYLWGSNTKVLRRCEVMDTSRPKDRARHIRMSRIELGYEAARALCGAAAMLEPPSGCPIIVFRMHE